MGAGGSTVVKKNVSNEITYERVDLPYLRTVWSFFRLIW